MAAEASPTCIDPLAVDPSQTRGVARWRLSELHRTDVVIALPVVETRAAPPVFRRSAPEAKPARGDWTIPAGGKDI
jgi:hypothetical protein